MPDVIRQNEAVPELREFAVDILNTTGVARAAGAASGAVIRIAKPGSNVLTVDSGCTLTEITGGADPGPYRLRLSADAVSVKGEVAWEVSNPGVSVVAKGSVAVVEIEGLYYGKVLAVGATTIDLDGATPGGGAAAVDGYYANVSAARACRVRIVAGQGAGQVRIGTDYVSANRRMTLDAPFTVAPDVSGGSSQSIVLLEPVAGGATTAQLVTALLANVMDPDAPANAQTFAQQWNILLSLLAGPGDGLDGPIGSTGPLALGDPTASPAPHRTEFTVISGRRRLTKLDGT